MRKSHKHRKSIRALDHRIAHNNDVSILALSEIEWHQVGGVRWCRLAGRLYAECVIDAVIIGKMFDTLEEIERWQRKNES